MNKLLSILVLAVTLGCNSSPSKTEERITLLESKVEQLQWKKRCDNIQNNFSSAELYPGMNVFSSLGDRYVIIRFSDKVGLVPFSGLTDLVFTDYKNLSVYLTRHSFLYLDQYRYCKDHGVYGEWR